MAVEYVNRKGQTYFLYEGETKTGKPKYYLSRQPAGTPMTSIPDGFEIYENPNAQPFIRRQLPKIIADDELSLVESEVHRFADLKYSLIDRKHTALTLYSVDNQREMIGAMRALGLVSGKADVDDIARRFWTYSAVIRFTLVDATRRIFQTQRYCFLGAIDDWIDIGKPGPLSALARRYIKHVGKDSFYDLF